MKVAYLDCFAGASGDMILAALIDAGAEIQQISKQVSRLDLSRRTGAPVELKTSIVTKSGIRATKVEIEGGDDKVVDTMDEAIEIVDSAGLEPEVARGATGVLTKLGEAEKRIHGTGETAEQAHLHELGTVDTLVDVVGVAAALAGLRIEKVVCSPIPTGSGTVRTSHGLMPVPAPAVVELFGSREDVLVASGEDREVQAELVTPTGAAILVHYSASFGQLPEMLVQGSGWGAGSKDLPFANLLRVILGTLNDHDVGRTLDVLIEANIDDMNPELYEYVLERLFGAGALDAWIVPAIGKRGRPLSVLTALAPSSMETPVRDVILAETSTIGLRTTPVKRWVLKREWLTVKVEGNAVRVKLAKRAGAVVNIAPEYSDCVEAARQTGLPLKEVFRRAAALVGETGVEPA